MVIVRVTLLSTILFAIAAIAKPHHLHEAPIDGWNWLMFLAGLGAFSGAIVGGIGGAISWLAGIIVGFTAGPKTARALCPFVSAITTGAAGTVGWISLDSQNSDPFLGSYWLIAGLCGGGLGGWWEILKQRATK
jgi:hypothetical protein